MNSDIDDVVVAKLASMSLGERRSLLARLAKEDRALATQEVRLVRPRLGEWLRNARSLAGMSQAGLADALRLSRPAVANIEAGRQSLTVELLLAAAYAVNADPCEAIRCTLGGEPARKGPPTPKGRPRGRIGDPTPELRDSQRGQK